MAGSTEFSGRQVDGVDAGEYRSELSYLSEPWILAGPRGVLGVRGVRGVGAEKRGVAGEGRMPVPLLLGGALFDMNGVWV